MTDDEHIAASANMGLDFHRSLFQIIFHLLVSERTYSDCENTQYFDVVERFLWTVYYVLAILAIAAVVIVYCRCRRSFASEEKCIGSDSAGPVLTSDAPVQTGDGWSLSYRQNDELRQRANIQHRRLKKVINDISNKKTPSKKMAAKPSVNVSRWMRKKGDAKPANGCVKMLLERKEQLLERVGTLSDMYSEAMQVKKDLKCALSISENQLFQNNRDAQLNWIHWQYAQRTMAATTTKAMKMKNRIQEDKKMHNHPSSNFDIALSTTSPLMNDVAAALGVDSKNALGSDSDGSHARHRNPSGDAKYAVAMDDAPRSTDIRGSQTNDADSATDAPFQRHSSSSSPDRYRVAKNPTHISFSPECESKSTKLAGITAGAGGHPRAPFTSPERAGTVGSACERLRSSVSPDRCVGQVIALKPPMAADSANFPRPARIAQPSPERPAQKQEVPTVDESTERLAVSSEFLHRSSDRIRLSQEARRGSSEARSRGAVVPEGLRPHASPERRPVAISPTCPRVDKSPDHRRVPISDRRHAAKPSPDRRVFCAMSR